MKKYFYIILFMLPIAAMSNKVNAQSNLKTETFHVSGNCGMCKENIEEAVNIKGVKKADWNKETKMIIVEYDETKVNLDKIKKKIAGAGYDNDLYKAEDADYNSLHGCCQYVRETK